MCLAVYQGPGARMEHDEMYNAWTNNPDGGGFAFIDGDGQLVVRKFMKFNEMVESYNRAVKLHGEYSPFVIHFRLATHGAKNLANCHPFEIDDDNIMIHNGVLPVIQMDKQMSDSYAFAKDYLARLPKGWMDDPFLFDLVEEYLGSNKIIILTTDPHAQHHAYIFNESHGDWNKNKDMWFSNSSHCSIPKNKYPVIKSAQELIEYDSWDYSPGVCSFCMEESVLDDNICYTCEMCNQCDMYYEQCLCKSNSIHRMSDHQFYASEWKP